MKKLTTLLLIFLVLLFPGIVKAAQANVGNKVGVQERSVNATSGTDQQSQERIENQVRTQEQMKNNKTASLEAKKNQALVRVRASATARWGVFNRVTSRAGELLDKLQIRITAAKNSGKNTADLENWMTDARVKLADSQNILTSLQDKKGTAMTRSEFQDIQSKFKIMHMNLNTIRLDAAKMISSLKAINSVTNSASEDN